MEPHQTTVSMLLFLLFCETNLFRICHKLGVTRERFRWDIYPFWPRNDVYACVTVFLQRSVSEVALFVHSVTDYAS